MEIEKCRKAAGLLQKDLAEQMGVSRPAVANWECGITCPKAEDLPKLATVLRCSIDDLFGFVPISSIHHE